MRLTSPCAACKWGGISKNKRRCVECVERIAYAEAIEGGPACRQDPVYAAAYTLPRSFARQIGTLRLSEAALTPTWR
jgi:hypothetical protein